jgi:hypothetical protein
MKQIPLTNGSFVLVDDEDFEFLSQWKWHLSDGGYALRNNHKRLGVLHYSNKQIRMHRVINNTPEGLFTDHINRNKLDNRKCNLRTVNKSLNSINRDKPINNKSGYRGVYWDTWSKKWRAELKVNAKKVTLGRYSNLEDAATARMVGERKYYGTV